MRLKQWEIDGIAGAIEALFQANDLSLKGVELHLYGSRVDDKKKGGDIDLLLRVPDELLSKVKALKFSIDMEMQERIGEQKIDLLIMDHYVPQEPFHRLALKQAKLMKKW